MPPESDTSSVLCRYAQPASDKRKKRPVVLLMHGGGFLFNDKTSDTMPELGTLLAQRGYVAVSINYRLTGNYYGLFQSEQYVHDAVEDAKAAVRFLRKVRRAQSTVTIATFSPLPS